MLSQQQLQQQNEVEDDDDGWDDLDAHSGYRRPKLVSNEIESDLSDYTKARLALARELAMQAYRKKYA